MPLLETDFLKALLDPKDRLHTSSERALSRVQRNEWNLASSALLELDLLLKHGRVSSEERSAIFETLSAEIPREMIVGFTHASLSAASRLQVAHKDVSNFYFDSIHLALSMELDGKIVSSDRFFDRVTGIKRIPLEAL